MKNIEIKKVLMLIVALLLIAVSCGKKSEEATNNNMGANSVTENSSSTASQNNESKNKNVSPQSDINSFAENYLAENRKIKNVEQNSESSFNLFGTIGNGKAKHIFEYNDTQAITRYYTDTVLQDNQSSVTTNFIYVAPDKYYAKDRSGKWIEVPDKAKEIHKNIGVVDYFKLVNSLADILVKEQGKYEIKEVNGSYEIIINKKEFDFQKYFYGIIELNLNDLNIDEVEKNIVFKINKDTLLFESVDVKLNYEREGVKLDVKTIFRASEWNKANTTIFNEIQK